MTANLNIEYEINIVHLGLYMGGTWMTCCMFNPHMSCWSLDLQHKDANFCAKPLSNGFPIPASIFVCRSNSFIKWYWYCNYRCHHKLFIIHCMSCFQNIFDLSRVHVCMIISTCIWIVVCWHGNPTKGRSQLAWFWPYRLFSDLCWEYPHKSQHEKKFSSQDLHLKW